MTAPYALIIGAVIIAASNLAGMLLTPYRMSSAAIVGGFNFAWRINTTTGDIRLCKQVDTTWRVNKLVAEARSYGYTDEQISPYREAWLATKRSTPVVYDCDAALDLQAADAMPPPVPSGEPWQRLEELLGKKPPPAPQ